MFRAAATALAASVLLLAGDDAPQWLREDAGRTVKTYSAKVPAVVLRSEARVVVDEDGSTTTTTLYAVRILNNDGRARAVARQAYVNGSGKVKEFRAWLIRPSGEVKKYGKDATLDIAMVDGDVYNEVRVRAIVATGDAEPGAVFGFEAVAEDRSIFAQNEWTFQDDLPVLASRYSVVLPRDWKAEALTFNHDSLTPAISGATYTWELANLEPVESEPAMPSVSALAPRLAVSYVPPAPHRALRTFGEWSDVAAYLRELNDPQMATAPDLVEKAQSLTRSADSAYAKIAAIGRFAQSIRYVAIQTGIGRGGGYRPHPAAEVFTKGYGDCKDKANLMRTMLKAVGIEAFPVAIYSGDRTRVRESWPSPQQFNHAILAVRVGPEVREPAVAEFPGAGRLLFFDPTAENTPPGNLPEAEQGSLALVAAPGLDGLARMPVAEADANRLERTVEAQVDASGKLSLAVQEVGSCHVASVMRGLVREQSESAYRKWVEAVVASTVRGAQVSGIRPDDKGASFELHFSADAPKYAQLMQNRLLMFRTSALSRWESPSFPEKTRRYPIVFDAHAFEETARFRVPAGFAVDELPEAFDAATPFATYEASCAAAGDELVCKRRLQTVATTIPASDYPGVRSFFEKVAGYEGSPAVLIRR